MADGAGSPVEAFVRRAVALLEPGLDAVYAFGSEFGRGEKAPDAHLLVLVQKLDRAVLDNGRTLAAEARALRIAMRLVVTSELLRSSDVFPNFVLELIDTKALLAGKDVLADLAVDTSHLRLRAEQSLRGLKRDLLQAYLDAADDQRLAVELRRSVRRAIYLLRALALVCRLELPSPPTVEGTIDVVIGALVPAEREAWHRMRRFGAFEDVLDHDALDKLYCESLASLSALTDAVDRL